MKESDGRDESITKNVKEVKETHNAGSLNPQGFLASADILKTILPNRKLLMLRSRLMESFL